MLFPRLFQLFLAHLRETWRTFYPLLKILLPLGFATRLAAQFGLIDLFGNLLEPSMKLVGLPGSMALVWAAAMFGGIYGAMVVFAEVIASGEIVTIAQSTIVSAMILVAHTLPVELAIARRAGCRFPPMLVLRVGGAFLLAACLNLVYRWGGWLQETNRMLWTPPTGKTNWGNWLLGTGKSLLVIFAIVFLLLAIMRTLRAYGILRRLDKCFAPVLRLLGMSAEVAPLTVIGMTLGISYGGGLIIREAQSGKLSNRDILSSLTFLGLCHSVFEDTLLLLVFGASLSGILWGRIAFALVATFIIARLTLCLPDRVLHRWLVLAPQKAAS